MSTGSKQGRAAVVDIRRAGDRRSLSRSATRALDLLEMFGQERRALRAVEIGDYLGIYPSTTNQLLKTMLDSGHLVFEARSKTYLPSVRLGPFADWITQALGAGNDLRGMVRDLACRTGMIVTLATPNDRFMQVIELAAPAGHDNARGLRIAIFGSALGAAYLSMLGPDDIIRLAHRNRVPEAEIPQLIAAALDTAAAGHADSVSSDDGDGIIRSLAMPLPMHGLGVPTILGLAGPADAIEPEAIGLLRDMTEAIARWVATGPTGSALPRPDNAEPHQ